MAGRPARFSAGERCSGTLAKASAATRGRRPAGGESVFSAGGLDEDDEHAWLPEQLARSQAQTAKTTGGPAGTVILTSPMRVGFLSQDPDDVVTFVENFVASRPSDVAKLGRAGTAERHLFIWGGVFSTGWVSLRALELDVPQLPLRAPSYRKNSPTSGSPRRRPGQHGSSSGVPRRTGSRPAPSGRPANGDLFIRQRGRVPAEDPRAVTESRPRTGSRAQLQ